MEPVKFNLKSMLEGMEEVSYESILEHFKDNHYHKLFVKKVDEGGDLVMIYNNLDTAKDNKLYQECRSIVYDVKGNKIVSYSHDNVKYATMDDFKKEEGDVVEESYEGTMIGVYNHDGVWYFSSTRCPDVNKSFYFNQKKSHGEMLDDVLSKFFPEEADVREAFTNKLNVNNVYYFVLLHHENKYLVDYTSRFGEGYRELVHIITRVKDLQVEVEEKLDVGNLIIPQRFKSFEEGMLWVEKYDVRKGGCVEWTEGLIVKRFDGGSNKNELIKVPSKTYVVMRYERPNNLNPWVNCIDIFQRNNKSYTADMYMKKYVPEKEMKDIFGSGKHLDVTGVLCAVIRCLAIEILNIYSHFTKYDVEVGKYEKLNAEDYALLADSKQLKVLKVTLNRLQNYQYKYFKGQFSMSDIVDHLRYHTTATDVMELIKIHDYLRKENHKLFKIMNGTISNKETIDRFVKTYIFYHDN